jgi:hypothetical protein
MIPRLFLSIHSILVGFTIVFLGGKCQQAIDSLNLHPMIGLPADKEKCVQFSYSK